MGVRVHSRMHTPGRHASRGTPAGWCAGWQCAAAVLSGLAWVWSVAKLPLPAATTAGAGRAHSSRGLSPASRDGAHAAGPRVHLELRNRTWDASREAAAAGFLPTYQIGCSAVATNAVAIGGSTDVSAMFVRQVHAHDVVAGTARALAPAGHLDDHGLATLDVTYRLAFEDLGALDQPRTSPGAFLVDSATGEHSSTLPPLTPTPHPRARTHMYPHTNPHTPGHCQPSVPAAVHARSTSRNSLHLWHSAAVPCHASTRVTPSCAVARDQAPRRQAPSTPVATGVGSRPWTRAARGPRCTRGSSTWRMGRARLF